MHVKTRQLEDGFVEHVIVDPRMYSYHAFRHGDLKSVSACGKYWAFASESTVYVVEGLDVLRASYTALLTIRELEFTPHTTMLVRHEVQQFVTELDVDGRITREIDLEFIPDRLVCTKTHIVFVKGDSYKVFDYKSGSHVSTLEAGMDVWKTSLQYSPFTQRLYAQTRCQSMLRAYDIGTNGEIIPDPVLLLLKRNRIGSQLWSVTGPKDFATLDFSIYFRGQSICCDPNHVWKMCAIPGGFVLFKPLAVYFIMDCFTYTKREAFLRILLSMEKN